MNKTDYTAWLAKEVTPRFKVGAYVTMRGMYYIPGKIPDPVFKITDITEIYFLAQIDPNWNEPRALCVKSLEMGVHTSYPPCVLRPLNEEETKLVNARDTAKQVREEAAKAGNSVASGSDTDPSLGR